MRRKTAVTTAAAFAVALALAAGGGAYDPPGPASTTAAGNAGPGWEYNVLPATASAQPDMLSNPATTVSDGYVGPFGGIGGSTAV